MAENGPPPGEGTPEQAPPQEPGGSRDGGLAAMPADGTEGYGPGGVPFPGGFVPGGFPEGGVPDGTEPGTEGEPGAMAFGMQVPKSLREQAVEAFRRGDDAQGFRLLYGHFLADPSAKEDLVQKMVWLPGLKRPALGPRIGVVAFYNRPPPEFDASPQPIGSPELSAAMAEILGGQGAGSGNEERRPRVARGRRGPASDAPAPEIAPGGEMPQRANSGALAGLEFFTGELGAKLVEGLQQRIARGDYGPLFKEIHEEISRPAVIRGPDGELLPGAAPGSDGGPGGLAAPTAGLEGTDGPGGPGQLPGQGKAAAASQAGVLAVGVAWLGQVNSREELMQKAHEAGVDVLVTYEITLRLPRNSNLVNNSTRIRISLVRDDSAWFTSAALDNRTVLLAREKGQKGEDPVDKEVGRALAALDEKLRPAPLPASLTPSVIQQRVASLVEQRPIDPWAAAVEVRFYAAKGWLEEQAALEAIASLVGTTEYARLLASVPGGSLTQQLGTALSLPNLLDMVRGVNMAGRMMAPAMRAGSAGGAFPGGGQPRRSRPFGGRPIGPGSPTDGP
jgi:hypothetical protein